MDGASHGDGIIEIRTRAGLMRVRSDEIVGKRLGLNLERRSLVLEYEVPEHHVKAHHIIPLADVEAGPPGPSAFRPPDRRGGEDASVVDSGASISSSDSEVAARLRHGAHAPWLSGVSEVQLVNLIARLRAAHAKKSGTKEEPAPAANSTAAVTAKADDSTAAAKGLEPTSKEAATPAAWNWADSFFLCKVGEEAEFRDKVRFLSLGEADGVRHAAEGLNSGRVSCSEACDAVAIRASGGREEFYVLYRAGKREQALKQLGLSEDAVSPVAAAAAKALAKHADLKATEEGVGKTDDKASDTASVSRRERRKALPPVARASARTKEKDMQKVFDEILAGTSQKEDGAASTLSLSAIQSYLCDYLGFGLAEAELFFELREPTTEPGLAFDQFKKGYASLNPFVLMRRKQEVIMRKPGALAGQSLSVEELEDCEVYICDVSAQALVDACKRCILVLGPCESSAFIRECEDCICYLACQQLRTRDCKNCTFYLYSKTEPIIETSENLSFAPWTARYPNCTKQFEQVNFDPERNFWNAIFDFSGKVDRSHWRILPLQDIHEVSIELDDAPAIASSPDSPCPAVTHEMLCAAPIASENDTGQGVANIPQTRPEPPAAPTGPAATKKCVIKDGSLAGRTVGAGYLEESSGKSR